VVIAPPGNAKTAAIKFCAEPFLEEQKKLLAAYKVEKKQWDRDADTLLQPGDEPELPSLYCKDVTREQIDRLLARESNWRGMPIIRDEIMGFINSMDEYRSCGKGGDRQFYLDLWNCNQTKTDRRNLDNPSIVTDPVVPILGGTQPSKLPDLRGRGMTEDGFIDRFLPAFPVPNRPRPENWLGVSRKVRKSWAGVVRKLWALPVHHKADSPQTRIVRLTDTGKRAWERFTRYVCRLQECGDFVGVIHNTLYKLTTYGIRLALIMHFLRLACREVEYEDVDGDSVKRATRLVAYFFSHIKKVHGVLESDPRVADARRILACLKRHRMNDFTRRDLYLKMRSSFRGVTSLNPPLRLLQEHGYLWEMAPDASSSRPGPRSERYLVHPSLNGVRAEGLPTFELTAAGLARCWVYYSTRVKNGVKADTVSDATPAFDELLRQGFPAAELLALIQEDDRNRSEYLWAFEKRLHAGSSAGERDLAYTTARKQASAAERQRIDQDACQADRDGEQRTLRWQALTEAHQASLRAQARASSPFLAQQSDQSGLLIDACLRLLERQGAAPEVPTAGNQPLHRAPRTKYTKCTN
jgi:hypothetical protein